MKQAKTKGKGVNKGKEPLKTSFRLSATTYFLTYKGISESGQILTKQTLANYLVHNNPNDLKLRPLKYLICQQLYDSGLPHFHAILIYEKRKQITSQDYYNYLGVHPNIQTMRNMKAALDYMYKQDPTPFTNMEILQERRVARAKNTSSLYQLLQQQMIKDPFNFDVFNYCLQHNLTKQIYKANYTKAVSLLRNVRAAYCNKLLFEKNGFKPITRALIQQLLSPSDLKSYDSWPGYQTIVDFLNILNTQRGRRQQKSMNLLISGPPSTGKSALFWQRNPLPGRSSVVAHLPLYPMGMKDWFPDYKSDVYAGIYWNQAKLTSYAYDVVLQLLDGSPVMLPAKGGGHKKVDNPTVIMTSNMTLQQMIYQKFYYNKSYLRMAQQNLAVRVHNVIIPPGYTLFLLQKLLVAPDCWISTCCLTAVVHLQSR